MLDKKNCYVLPKIFGEIKYHCLYIKTKELKKITGYTIKELDHILTNTTDIPIVKVKKGVRQVYYGLPLELMITYCIDAMEELLHTISD